MRTMLALATCWLTVCYTTAGASTRSSEFGNAFEFDGTDDYVWITPIVSGQAEGTVELWVRPVTSSANTAIWVGGNGHPGVNGDWTRLGYHSSTNGLSFGFYGGAWRWAPSGRDLVVGEWHHLAATWSSAGKKLYINGELAGSGSSASAPSYTMDLIGTSAWGNFFTGSIDEVRFWSVAREEAEILSGMYAPIDPDLHPDLLAYYRFDGLEDLGVGDAGADDVRDLSGNDHHAEARGEMQLVTGAVPVEDLTWGAIKALYQ